jgi:hypothetical protein
MRLMRGNRKASPHRGDRFRDRIKGDLDDNRGFDLNPIAAPRDRQIKEPGGELSDFRIREARIGLAYGQKKASGFVVHGECIVA